MGILTIPEIQWDTGPKTLTFPDLPLDNPRSWAEPAPGSEWHEGPSGAVSAWVTGDHQFLEGVVRHIPSVDTGGISGWESTDGWLDFLAFAWRANTFNFVPDRATPGVTIPCYLVAPRSDYGHLDQSSVRRNLTIVLRSSDGSKFLGYGLS